MSKYKYICVNCGTGQKRKYIDAMRKAGFNLQNLACRECGMDAIKTAENGINSNTTDPVFIRLLDNTDSGQ